MSGLNNLGLLGCGNMGGAVARGVIASNVLEADKVFLFDPEPKAMEPLQQEGCIALGSPTELFQKAEAIVLAIKPQVFKTFKLPTLPHDSKTIISVMAGIKTDALHRVFPISYTIVRVMPNLGLSVGEGATAIATDSIPEEAIRLAEIIFYSCGTTVRVEENLIDAVTGVSGSGPMYFFEFIEALTQAGVNAGLDRDTAYRLALQTGKGSLKLLETSGDAPSNWSARVRSPGGTTAEAQKVLEEGGFQELLIRAVEAAVKRSKELSD